MSKSYQEILDEALSNAPPGIDTRQGSIYYDSIAGICLTIARLYADIETQGRLVTIVRAIGDELTEKAAEYGITRHPAAPASIISPMREKSRLSANAFITTELILFSCTAKMATTTCRRKWPEPRRLSAAERQPSP